MHSRLVCLFILIVIHFKYLVAQSTIDSVYNIRCFDIRNYKIDIDGIPDETFWKQAASASAFINSDPIPGVPFSSPIEVKVAYDNEGLYIAMRAFIPSTELKKEYSERDDYQNTDYFSVLIDTYQSGTTGYQFSVSPRNVQMDAIINGSIEDNSWDAVWLSKTHLDSNHWSLEMKLPYSALRFPKKDEQQWNINFYYSKRVSREKASWRPVNVLEEGLVQQCGTLEEIRNIQPPVRLTLLPYFTTYYSIDNKKPWHVTGGLDLKYGLSDAYTLDMTLIPDFGQVTFDDRINNLSAFEVAYEERRPFFTEGLDLFERANIFYSRRIGANNAQLINAFKITGRNKKGLAVGVLNAVEDISYGFVFDSLMMQIGKVKVSPLTNYNVLVFDQILPNNSYVSLINANTLRKGSERDANNTGLDFYVRNKAQDLFVAGDAALAGIYNPGSRQLGYRYHVVFGKNSGKFTYSAEYNETARDYDPTDLGYIYYYNTRETSLNFSYTDLRAKNNLIKRVYSVNTWYARYIDPDNFFSSNIFLNTFYLYKNFFGWFTLLNLKPRITKNFYETRRTEFNRYFNQPANIEFSSLISSDYRKKLAIDLEAGYTLFSRSKWNNYFIELKPRIRFNDYFSIFGSIEWSKSNNENGFYFDNRHRKSEVLAPDDLVFSMRDVNNIIVELTPKIKINNNLNISIRFRNYWLQVDVKKIFVLDPNGNLGKEISFTPIDNRHFSFPISNFETRINWRFSPGSDIIVAWNSGVNKFVNGKLDYWKSYQYLWGQEAISILSLRITYYLDFLRVKKLFHSNPVKNE